MTSPGIEFRNLFVEKQHPVNLVHLRHPGLNAVAQFFGLKVKQYLTYLCFIKLPRSVYTHPNKKSYDMLQVPASKVQS